MIFVDNWWKLCYNSLDYLRELDYMNNSLMLKLIKENLFNVKDYLINNYKRMGLNEQEVLMLIHIYNISLTGENFLSIYQLQDKMTLEFVECSNLVYQLVQKNFLAFEMEIDEKGKRKEKFTLEPLFNAILKDLHIENVNLINKQVDLTISSLISILESEFGRTLSPLEMEMIKMWFEQENYDSEIIKLAIKEALIAGAYNLKYIDRILINWRQRNLNTKEEVQDYLNSLKRYENKIKDTI